MKTNYDYASPYLIRKGKETTYNYVGFSSYCNNCDYIEVVDGKFDEEELKRIIEKNVSRYIYLFITTTKYARNEYDYTTIYWSYEIQLLPNPTKRINDKMYFDAEYSKEYAFNRVKELIKSSGEELVKELQVNWCKYNLKTSSPVNKHLKAEAVEVLEELKDE